MIKFKNTKNSYGWISILLHWLSAILIVALFTVGFLMVEFEYYSPYYIIAPWYHKSFGLVLFGLIIFRIIWKNINIKPNPVPTLSKKELNLSRLGHLIMYLLLIICCLSGYLISTGEGVGVDFFNLIVIPATLVEGSSQVDIAGKVHKFSTYLLVGCILLHAFAAFKHHFINKNNVLLRMLKPNKD